MRRSDPRPRGTTRQRVKDAVTADRTWTWRRLPAEARSADSRRSSSRARSSLSWLSSASCASRDRQSHLLRGPALQGCPWHRLDDRGLVPRHPSKPRVPRFVRSAEGVLRSAPRRSRSWCRVHHTRTARDQVPRSARSMVASPSCEPAMVGATMPSRLRSWQLDAATLAIHRGRPVPMERSFTRGARIRQGSGRQQRGGRHRGRCPGAPRLAELIDCDPGQVAQRPSWMDRLAPARCVRTCRPCVTRSQSRVGVRWSVTRRPVRSPDPCPGLLAARRGR